MVIINCVFSNELGYGWFKWSLSHFNKIYVVSLGKLFLVLALVAKLLVSGVSDFDEGSPGDVGSATSGRRSLLVRPCAKTKTQRLRFGSRFLTLELPRMGYMKRCHKAKDGSVGASCTCTGTGKRASPRMLGEQAP